MSKGLFIARSFYLQGHRVIGADFEPNGIPICGRFSKALAKFFRLSPLGTGAEGPRMYIRQLVRIIEQEKVDLWISCSGVASALEDARAAETVEASTDCKVIQFGVDLTATLHEKDTFIEQTRRIGLNVPETHAVKTVAEALSHLYDESSEARKQQFIVKPIGMDDIGRADIMTPLPRATYEETRDHLKYLRIDPSRPFILQQYIDGPEYCTHSIIVRGQVMAFTACPSAELLMHYHALSSSSDLFQTMLDYTHKYASKLGVVNGHFSIDFILQGKDHGDDLSERLFPIECNPRAHTADVLFENQQSKMVDAYLSVLQDEEDFERSKRQVVFTDDETKVYWIGHDLVTRGILPLFQGAPRESWTELVQHICTWKDGTYAWWDPWPFWCLYCVTWPGLLIAAMVRRNWWSRGNVSTMKMFRC